MTERANVIRESIDFLHRYTMKVLQKKAEEYGITAPQARVIAEVLSHKTISIKQLSQNLRMTQSTASDVVERLTKKGFLLKKPSAKDKRSVDISVSDEFAKEIEKTVPTIINQSFIDVLNLLQPNEQEMVEAGMRLLVAVVKEKIERDGIHNFEFFDNLLFPGENSENK